VRAGRVVAQSAAPGARIPQGSAVQVSVSTGHAPRPPRHGGKGHGRDGNKE